MACSNCPPYVGSSIIDEFERVVSGAWGTPTRGIPDWEDFFQAANAPSTSQIEVSAIGPSTGWGRINLLLNTPGSVVSQGASRELRLPIEEITNLDDFALQFNLAVNPAFFVQGVADAQIRLGGSPSAPGLPMLDINIRFLHFAGPGDTYKFFLARDALGGVEHTVTETIANAHSLDALITIDRSVVRGSTLVTVGALGAFVFAPISPASGSPSKILYVGYSDNTTDATVQTSHLSIDNIAVIRGSTGLRPLRGQPVNDEYVATGDGGSTSYATRWPYLTGSLEVQVAGIVSELDNSSPATGDFELVDPAPSGARIIATYRARGF